MDTLGTRIKQRLDHLGLSFEQAAELIGVSWQAVQQWANNRTTPRKSKEQAIADALQCDRDWLFYPERLVKYDMRVAEQSASEVYIEFKKPRANHWPFSSIALQRFLDLNPKDKQFVEGVLREAIIRCEDNGSSKRRSPAAR